MKEQEAGQGGATGIVVYLCTGEVRLVPLARNLTFNDDRLICFDEGGHQVASFDSRQVYMCSKGPTPVEPRV